MAASPARDISKAATPGQTGDRAHLAREALLAQLAAERSRPGYSLIVLAGIVRAIELGLIAIAGLLPYALYVAPAVGYEPSFFIVIPAVSTAGIVVFQALRTYNLAAFRQPLRQLFRIAGGWSLVFLIVFAMLFLLKIDGAISRVWIVAWYMLGITALGTDRILLARICARLAQSGRLDRRAVVVGGGDFGVQLLRELASAGSDEVHTLGVFDDRSNERAPDSVEGFPKLGNVDDLLAFARNTRVDLVIFALPITAEERILQMLRKLWVLPIDIRLAAHANRLRFRPRSYSYVGRAPMLDLLDKPIADWDVVIKLAFDKIVGAMALLALSPIFLATAIAIKLDTRGPVFFRQKRYGFNNEQVDIFKFRSLHADRGDANASQLVTRNDPRVTRVGRFIRRTSIDELPQLFNVVFKGNLSLVGPRPHALHAKAANRHYDEVVDGYFARHRVRPGITGWAQVNGWRGETDTPEKIQQRVEHDLYYIENWSILLDLYILAITPASLMNSSNAY
jgi:Undecaprenyl-phosphate glucose phosphotransferase